MTMGDSRVVSVVCEAASFNPVEKERLERLGVKLVNRNEGGERLSEHVLLDQLSGAWCVIAGSETYSKYILDSAQGLRAIVRYGAGYDNIDVISASRNGILVVTTPGANAEAVAEFAVGMIIGGSRRIIALSREVVSGGWEHGALSPDVAGSTVGIIGLGNIGKAVASRLVCLGCRVIATEEIPDEDFVACHGIEIVSLDTLLSTVDTVSCHVPLTESTYHLVGDREFAVMRDGVGIVNTARGGLIDEDALVKYLERGKIGWAALDVTEQEPLPVDSKLRGYNNVIVTPHAASYSFRAAEKTRGMILSAIESMVENEIPDGTINKDAW